VRPVDRHDTKADYAAEALVTCLDTTETKNFTQLAHSIIHSVLGYLAARRAMFLRFAEFKLGTTESGLLPATNVT
jgi:hypothetical protein